MNYGIKSDDLALPREEILSILNAAHRHKITDIDTAKSYGNCETVLGECGVGSFQVTTKIIIDQDHTKLGFEAWLLDQIEDSLAKLKIDKLYGLLVHNSDALLSVDGGVVASALEKARKLGLVKKVGFSIYSPSNLNFITEKFWPDLLQSPYNILDHRLACSGWLNVLKNNGTEVHCRSVFLKGLITTSVEQRPPYFSRWKHVFDGLDRTAAFMGLSQAELCLIDVLKNHHIDKIVVGVQSERQLLELVEMCSSSFQVNIPSFCSDDLDLIEPYRWPANL